MSILKIRSRQEALAIQYTGNNRQELIDFLGENYIRDDKIGDLIQEPSPELTKEKPPQDFFEILRIMIDQDSVSPVDMPHLSK